MTTLHDLMAASIDGRAVALGAADAAPSGSTRGLIGRRRRRNVAIAGGSSALAIGGIVASGVVPGARTGGVEAAATPTSPLTTASVIVTLESNTDSVILGWDDRLSCGSTVPRGTAAVEGFTQNVSLSGDRTLTVDAPAESITTTLAYAGAGHPPVFIDAGEVVLVKDRIVVATFDGLGYSENAPYESFTDGASWTSTASTKLGDDTGVNPCSTAHGFDLADDTALAAGEYQLYVISRAHVTERQVAIMSLLERGLSLPVGDYGDLTPGSSACDDTTQTERFFNPDVTLVLCDPSVAPDVTIDRANKLATVPYRASDFDGEVNVTLVSDPVTFTVPKDVTWAEVNRGWTEEDVTACLKSDGAVCVNSLFPDDGAGN